MKNNQKMFFIKNIDDLENEIQEFDTREYEVLTDSFTIGQLNLWTIFFYDLGIWKEKGG